MILVDTSVWIDFFAGRDLPQVVTLEQFIHDSQDIALCGIILTEILQGIADDSTHRRVQRYLGPLITLPCRKLYPFGQPKCIASCKSRA